MAKSKQKRSLLHRWLISLIWIFGCITLVGGALAGLMLSRITGESGWRALLGGGGSAGGSGAPISSAGQIDKFVTNVLIVVQNESLGGTGAQADMIFLASFNALYQELNMVSLLPETIVSAQGRTEKTLNELYVQGGPTLLASAINESFALDVQSYACTDTHALATMIDLLGGIRVNITPEEAAYLNDTLSLHAQPLADGALTLTGTQCMAHALDRLSGTTPESGAMRGLALVESAVQNMRTTATKEAMLPLLALVFSSIQTNLDLETLRNIGYEILKAEEMDHNSLILPAEGSWDYDSNGSGVIHAKLDINAQFVRERLYHAE